MARTNPFPWLLLLTVACGPTEQEKSQVALDVYEANATRVLARRDAMRTAFARVSGLGAEEKGRAFDLGRKPPLDISTWPKNALLVSDEEGIAARFHSVERLRDGFEIHANDSLADVEESAHNVIKAWDRLRYLCVIEVLELREPRMTGDSEHKKTGITLGFVPGEAKGRAHVFDLEDGKYMGSVPIQARNSPRVKLRPTEFDEQIKFELRRKLEEAATTELQFWDEVNGKK